MFTGLVQHLAPVAAMKRVGPGVRLDIDAGHLASDARSGDSISVNGCCLTVVSRSGPVLGFDAGEETLSRTNIGRLKTGDAVNLERSLKAGDSIGGHWVTGHVDELGTLDERHDDHDWSKFWFRVPPRLTRQMASKGSIAVDGASLTLVDVEDERFSVALIPHTLRVTTLGQRQPGDQVNIETDVLAKYVERQLAAIGRTAT